MREPRKIIVALRFDGEGDAEWAVAQRRHAVQLAASKVREHIDDLLRTVVGERGDAVHLDVVVAVGRAVLGALPGDVDGGRRQSLKRELDILAMTLTAATTNLSPRFTRPPVHRRPLRAPGHPRAPDSESPEL